MGGDGFQMSRFYVNILNPQTVIIKGSDFNHMKNVLRMSAGDSLTLCDGKGVDYSGVIESYGHEGAIVRILSTHKNTSEPDVLITLFQGIPKTGKMEVIIAKAVELGVFSIVPVMTVRTVVRLDSDRDKAAKRDRWQKIAIEAAKQCNRGIIPEVMPPLDFREAINKSSEFDISIIPYENEKCLRLSGLLAECPIRRNAKVSIFIGPEGGFSEQEVETASGMGAVRVSLGSRILRTETAGIAVISVIMSHIGEM